MSEDTLKSRRERYLVSFILAIVRPALALLLQNALDKTLRKKFLRQHNTLHTRQSQALTFP